MELLLRSFVVPHLPEQEEEMTSVGWTCDFSKVVTFRRCCPFEGGDIQFAVWLGFGVSGMAMEWAGNDSHRIRSV